MVNVKTLDISFCGKRARNIVNLEAKDVIMKFFSDKEIKINQRYANLLQSSALNYLSKQPFILLKTINLLNFSCNIFQITIIIIF